MLIVKRIENNPVKSNCFIIHVMGKKHAIIIDPKKNLSIFYNQIGFHCAKADQTFTESTYDLIWHDQKIEFFKTPGHTNGSICILLDSCLITGDTLLENTKTVTKLPEGNNEKLIKSIKLIYSLQGKFKKIFPGHGNDFTLEE